MKLLDRIALERGIKLIMGFIISIIKLFVPTKNGDKPSKPRWRLRKND